MKASIEILFRIFLAILLFGCLLNMPYGYFQLVRFLSFIFFLLFAYNYSTEDCKIEMIVCISISLLFQPFFKIALGRHLWNVVDVIVAIALLLSIFPIRSRNIGSRKKDAEERKKTLETSNYSMLDKTVQNGIKMHIEKRNED